MARLPSNAFRTASSREKHCKPEKKNWQHLGIGHLGYRRPKNGTAGSWLARVRLPSGRYSEAVIGLADEQAAVADGVAVLTFVQADVAPWKALILS